MEEIIISKEHLEIVLKHANDEIPNEACGILGGRNNRVERVFIMSNIDASPVSYVFDSVEQMRVLQNLEREGLDMVGIYHSHPSSPAYPSQVDIERAFFPGTEEPNYPGVTYVIIGLTEGVHEVKAYRINTKRDIAPLRVRTDFISTSQQ